MTLILTFVLAYLLGSIPFGLLITRAARPRRPAQRSARATSAPPTCSGPATRARRRRRSSSTPARARSAVLLARAAFGETAALVAGLAAFLGHLFPVWLGFRGGKGVATFLGVMLALAWPAGLAACATWLAVAVLTRFSSLAALAAAAATPLWLAVFGRPDAVWLGIALAVLVFVRHHANIRRLLGGSEPRIGAGR